MYMSAGSIYLNDMPMKNTQCISKQVLVENVHVYGSSSGKECSFVW